MNTTKTDRNLASQSKTTGTTLAIGIKPRRADLLECCESAQRYLCAYIGGHFYWQPVTERGEGIVDSGIWHTGSAFHQRYWYNLGPLRRHRDMFVQSPAHRPVARAS